MTECQTTGPCQPTDRIERIETLLGELEALGYGAVGVPAPLMIRALATIEKARFVLINAAAPVTDGANADEDEVDEDPQPEVDNDLLERMYQKLAAGRNPPR